MQLDSSAAQPIAKEFTSAGGTALTRKVRTRRDASGAGQDERACPISENCPDPKAWSYMFVHNRDSEKFIDLVEKEGGFRTFIHRTVKYKSGLGDMNTPDGTPTISGLLFIQGRTDSIRKYLWSRFPQYHLVNDCCTGKTAVIQDDIMQPFMCVSKADPAKIRFLVNPLAHYAKGNTLVEVMTGPLAGLQGYIIRIDRDRKLVIGVGDMTVAIGGVHKEHFEKVEDVARQVGASASPQGRSGERTLTPMQESIDTAFFTPVSFNDVLVLATNMELWCDRAQSLLALKKYDSVREILPFLLEEAGFWIGPLFARKELDLSPIQSVARRVADKIEALKDDALLPETLRQDLDAAMAEQVLRHGYIFLGK